MDLWRNGRKGKEVLAAGMRDARRRQGECRTFYGTDGTEGVFREGTLELRRLVRIDHARSNPGRGRSRSVKVGRGDFRLRGAVPGRMRLRERSKHGAKI